MADWVLITIPALAWLFIVAVSLSKLRPPWRLGGVGEPAPDKGCYFGSIVAPND
jgi:hypothetical protein